MSSIYDNSFNRSKKYGSNYDAACDKVTDQWLKEHDRPSASASDQWFKDNPIHTYGIVYKVIKTPEDESRVIYPGRSKKNECELWYGCDKEAATIACFDYLFSEYCEFRTEENRKKGHPERKMTPGLLFRSKGNGVRKVEIQIGDKDHHLTEDQYRSIYNKYIEWHDLIFGNNAEIYYSDIRFDRHVPQLYLEIVFHYKDELGSNRPSIDGGLRESGIMLPDPTSKPGASNHREMTYMKMCRAELNRILKEETGK